MVAISVIGVIVALVGVIVGSQFVGLVDEGSRDTLLVTIESLDSLEDTIDLADRLVTSTVDTLDTVEITLREVEASFAVGDRVIGDVAELTGQAAPALGSATTTLRQLEGIGATIDGVLGDLSSLPFGGIDYDRDTGLGATIGDLADDLDPVAATLSGSSESLGDLTGSVDALQEDLAELTDSVAGINDNLSGTDSLLESYRANAADARRLAAETREDLESDVRFLRILLVLGGLNFAAGQIVPFWFGLEQLNRAKELEQINRANEEAPENGLA
jgi:ABC-type transporter Mla subunit MlaD